MFFFSTFIVSIYFFLSSYIAVVAIFVQRLSILDVANVFVFECVLVLVILSWCFCYCSCRYWCECFYCCCNFVVTDHCCYCYRHCYFYLVVDNLSMLLQFDLHNSSLKCCCCIFNCYDVATFCLTSVAAFPLILVAILLAPLSAMFFILVEVVAVNFYIIF